jgi:NADH dehydrogenase FAD-containing subunit
VNLVVDTATRIDRAKRTVALATREALNYD